MKRIRKIADGHVYLFTEALASRPGFEVFDDAPVEAEAAPAPAAEEAPVVPAVKKTRKAK